MKLIPTQTDETSLLAFGQEASAMLMRHDYAGLATRFGYALAYGRDPAAAMEADFLEAAASLDTVLPSDHQAIVVKYFKPNSSGLFAVVECIVHMPERTTVLLELIVTGAGKEKYITVEDFTGVAVQA